ncbi:MAG: adenylate kinase [Saprospiraceae bacterium]
MLKKIIRFFGLKIKTKKINLILFGPPGSGKGTQAKKLETKFGLVQISTGDLFRYELGNNTPLGKKARGFMDKGQLVPDEVTVGMLKNKIAQYPDVNGFIFDGFPRTIPQANALKALLKTIGQDILSLISLNVDDRELEKRLLERGKTSGRADDANVKVIRNRLEVYKQETAPVYSYYEKLGLAQTISGKGSIEEINTRLNKLINSLL